MTRHQLQAMPIALSLGSMHHSGNSGCWARKDESVRRNTSFSAQLTAVIRGAPVFLGLPGPPRTAVLGNPPLKFGAGIIVSNLRHLLASAEITKRKFFQGRCEVEVGTRTNLLAVRHSA
jgi:hypothetical protein